MRQAARLAFSMAADLPGRDITFEGDSNILAAQVDNLDISPDWAIEGEVESIRQLLQDHVSWKMQWTPRSLIKWGLSSGLWKYRFGKHDH